MKDLKKIILLEVRKVKNHNLKTWTEFFQAVKRGEKTFEERLDDRGYEVGDTLTLQEFDPNKQEYTGDVIVKGVPYILREPYAKDKHVIMSITDVKPCQLEMPKPWIWGNEVVGLDDKIYEAPTCPKCKEATYSMPNCPFCSQALKGHED